MNATPAAKKNNMILAAVAAGGILGYFLIKRNRTKKANTYSRVDAYDASHPSAHDTRKV
jgi:Na+/glutamate symporter